MSNSLKRDRLIEAATSLFYQHGVTATTLAAIAQQAEVPLGNVYYHFRFSVLHVITKRRT